MPEPEEKNKKLEAVAVTPRLRIKEVTRRKNMVEGMLKDLHLVHQSLKANAWS